MYGNATTAAGKHGNCISLDGTTGTYVKLANPTVFENTVYSVSCWIKDWEDFFTLFSKTTKISRIATKKLVNLLALNKTFFPIISSFTT